MSSVLKGMVAELGHPSAPLRGIAYTQVRSNLEKGFLLLTIVQIIALAKLRDASPYKLVTPFLPEISCFVVEQMLSSPMLLSQFTELIGVSRETFLKHNARLTLPLLVRKVKTKEIDEVARASGVPTSMLIISVASDILSHLFLFPDDVAAKGIDFITATLKPHIKDYRFKTVVEMCLDQLLFSIISEMGDPAVEVSENG
jgi:serine/threonine-protein kinase ATR